MSKPIIDPSIFRDYDIRAVVPKELNKEGLETIAKAIIEVFAPQSVQIGRDMRTTSPEFHKAFIETFINYGVNVVDIGLISTDMLYFAAGTFDEDMAITVSASHNPPEYNGLKIAKKGSIAVSGDSGIYDIREKALNSDFSSLKSDKKGELTQRDIMGAWIDHLMKFIDPGKMKPFHIVSDTGNGMAGHFMPHLESKLPWRVERLFYDLDGTFPNHIPSPIEIKNMQDCINKVRETGADVGMAFDGDGDRVFLVDETGRIVSGTVMTAIIADNLLQKNENKTILYNAIVGRVVKEVTEERGGKPIRVRVGHTLIKEAMRKEDGLFCGEHSGHYYFKENFYADSAIIAALLVLEQMSIQNKKLSELVDQYDKYFASGEINFTVEDKQNTMKLIGEAYQDSAQSIDWLDGVTVWFKDYWFNVRPSNTEPLLRLNVEADTKELMEKYKAELVDKIQELGGTMKS